MGVAFRGGRRRARRGQAGAWGVAGVLIVGVLGTFGGVAAWDVHRRAERAADQRRAIQVEQDRQAQALDQRRARAAKALAEQVRRGNDLVAGGQLVEARSAYAAAGELLRLDADALPDADARLAKIERSIASIDEQLRRAAVPPPTPGQSADDEAGVATPEPPAPSPVDEAGDDASAATEPPPPPATPTPAPALPVIEATPPAVANRPGVARPAPRREHPAIAALRAGRFEEAITAAADLPEADRMHVEAVARQASGDARRAQQLIERVLRDRPRDRAAAINAAAIWQDENPMRAASLLRGYLTAAPAEDEPVATWLGTAMTRGARVAVNRAFLVETRNWYLEYDRRLAARRADGRGRWGSQWLPRAEAEQLWREVIDAGEALDKADRDHARARQTLDEAVDALNDLNGGFRLTSEAERRRVRKRVEDAQGRLKSAAERLAKARDRERAARQPPFPERVPLVLPVLEE